MCLITYAPNGRETLDWDTLRYSKRSNDDGYGVSWYKDETYRWVTSRSLRPHTLHKVVRRIPKGAPVIIHQRFATHGEVSLDNTHPFDLNGGALLFHNGTISGTKADRYYKTWKDDAGKTVGLRYPCSDTAAYCSDELLPIILAAGYKWIKHPKGVESIESRVGYGNVILIAINGDPVPAIINEWSGTWDKNREVFYSNNYSRPGYGFSRYGGMYAGNYCDYGSAYNADDWEDLQNARKESDSSPSDKSPDSKKGSVIFLGSDGDQEATEKDSGDDLPLNLIDPDDDEELWDECCALFKYDENSILSEEEQWEEHMRSYGFAPLTVYRTS